MLPKVLGVFLYKNHACFGGPNVIHVKCSFARFFLRNGLLLRNGYKKNTVTNL
jgi:hypothetical protein